MSAKLRGTDQVAVCFFGEGALGQGVLYEVMNMAALWKLPVVYACENNLYNEYTHFSETTAGEMSARPKAFGIHTEEVDGQDVRAIYATAQRLVERARQGEGPAFMLCNTYRYHGHHVGDIQRSYYRSKEEVAEWKKRDPITRFEATYLTEGLLTDDLIRTIRLSVEQEFNEAVAFAEASPAPLPEECLTDVFNE